MTPTPTATVFLPYHALDAVHQRGTRAAQPDAATVVAGTLYCVTDEGGVLERSSGTVWESWGPALWSTGSVLFTYDFSTVTTEPPTGSQIRIDAAFPWTGATTIWIRNTTTGGIEIHGILMVITPASTIYLQNKTASGAYVLLTTTGDPVDKTSYVEFPVEWKNSGASLLNNQNVQLIIVRREG
jgi:hypothetical protein